MGRRHDEDALRTPGSDASSSTAGGFIGYVEPPSVSVGGGGASDPPRGRDRAPRRLRSAPHPYHDHHQDDPAAAAADLQRSARSFAGGSLLLPDDDDDGSFSGFVRERADRSPRPYAGHGGRAARDPFAPLAPVVGVVPYPTVPPPSSVSDSSSDDEDPASGLASGGSRRKKRAVPTARQRKRRKACVTFASFLPFLAALVALSVVFLGRGRNDDAGGEEGGAAARAEGDLDARAPPSVGADDAAAGAPAATDWPTLSPTGTAKGRVESSDGGPPSATTLPPTPAPVAPSDADDGDVAEGTQGNLRATASPAASPGGATEAAAAGEASPPPAAPPGPEEADDVLPVLLFTSDAYPLALCAGDCDVDDDCAGSLSCFQRNGLEPVYGCAGDGAVGRDYCFERPVDFLYAPSPEKRPLGRCEGDCDTNDDCEGSLRCFQREGDEAVPGCTGEGTFESNYCADFPLDHLSASNAYPLGLCEGDCDADADCEGSLVCEQRDDFAEVPGCKGRGRRGEDYCRPPTPSEAPGPGPTPAPVTANALPDPDPTPSSTTFPTAAGSDACVAVGAPCPAVEWWCCSGWCDKDDETGEKVCGSDGETPAPTLAPATVELTCVGGGAPCPWEKKLCCSGKCGKDKETKLEVCSPVKGEQGECFASGEPCTDKKLCCSGRCVKTDEPEEGIENGKDNKKKEEVCE